MVFSNFSLTLECIRARLQVCGDYCVWMCVCLITQFYYQQILTTHHDADYDVYETWGIRVFQVQYGWVNEKGSPIVSSLVR